MQNIFLYICGLVCINVVPVILMEIYSKKDGWVNKYSDKIFYLMGMINCAIVAAVVENTEIMFGTIIGAGFFYILVEQGIAQMGNRDLTTVHDGKDIQFLIFATAVVLFVAADYLLGNGRTSNVISRTDGVLLILVYGIYGFYLLKNSKEIKFREEEKDERKVYSKEDKNLFIKRLFLFLLLEVFVGMGAYLCITHLSLLAIQFRLNQFTAGAILLAWMMQLNILLKHYMEKKWDKRGEAEERCSRTYKRTGEVLFGITFILGIICVCRPTIISMDIIYNIIFLIIMEIVYYFSEKLEKRKAGIIKATMYAGFVIFTILP